MDNTSFAVQIQQATDFISSGKLEEGKKICEQILKKQPNNASALHGVGLVAFMKRDYETAIENFTRSVELAPKNSLFLGNMGEALRRSKKTEQALETFEKALRYQPGFMKAHLGIANSLSDLEMYQEAIARFRFILQIQPNFAPAYHYLGVLLIIRERVKEAIPLLKKAVALKEDYIDAKFSLANALEQDEQTEDAIKIYKEILEKQPNNPAVHNNLGNILKTLGRMDEAAEHFKKALDQNPDHVSSYYNMSHTKLGTDKDELMRLEKMLDEGKVKGEELSSLHFTLGKYYDDQGEYEKAFKHFESGNTADNRKEPYNRNAHSKAVDTIMQVFSREFFAKRFNMGSESEVPIFIFGMPRSGTTLTEQTISSHPKVYGAGELKVLADIVKSMQQGLGQGRVSYPQCVQLLDSITACTLGERYVNEVKGLNKSKSNVIHITDKMPGNYLHLGLIALLLPRAKLIHCRRDPMDSCFSCYSRHFTQVISYTRDLEDLGHQYQEYERLMAHWHKVLPVPILDVQYEDMVKDHEKMSGKILDFIGLEWDDACKDFHKTERAVKTASNWQVRQPIYNSSVAKWRHYEKHLQPLVDALGEYAPKSLAEGKKNKPSKAKAEKSTKKKVKSKARAA